MVYSTMYRRWAARCTFQSSRIPASVVKWRRHTDGTRSQNANVCLDTHC